MQDLTSVLIPIVRRVMPHVIANSIAGVQSMADAGGIFSMGYTDRFLRKIPVSKGRYNTFLRLYNRRKTQSLVDFANAGYPRVNVARMHMFKARDWCDEQFGKDGYVSWLDAFFFENEEDATLFKMRWC